MGNRHRVSKCQCTGWRICKGKRHTFQYYRIMSALKPQNWWSSWNNGKDNGDNKLLYMWSMMEIRGVDAQNEMDSSTKLRLKPMKSEENLFEQMYGSAHMKVVKNVQISQPHRDFTTQVDCINRRKGDPGTLSKNQDCERCKGTTIYKWVCLWLVGCNMT